ncbi:hypothetical protein FRACYDRAFT_247165 [Fragilariopsis cylindrus CCMP1102]|uniref:SAM domain-containing protein n=1 Tax=Fragilariopsis cylindrus CCMP1102 TaxID=635003 RepID=A0A1E7EXI8_9STRA|nr:hypothetical protein FRACYDRAFT_247165 [Fragilariopsis cylindrus CCMP1102]|eukprot:OEU10622.1 hypothetical protein FRACYDRAFT_247165 [Fragilariopsis cylindrus CCMP1102]
MTAKHHPYDTNTADASSHSPRYRAMPDSNTTGNNEDILSDYHTWSPNQLGIFFRKRGLSEYYDTLQKHKITGQLAPLLNDDDLKQMGIDIVGEERIFFSDCDRTCFTCNGFCPVDPSTYKLTCNHLKVKKVQPVRCGPVRLFCFGASYVSKNIDLSKVDDVDVMGIPAPCCHRTFCCSKGKDLVEVESRFDTRGTGKIFLVLEEGCGEAVANMILNQVEESQKMERT